MRLVPLLLLVKQMVLTTAEQSSQSLDDPGRPRVKTISTAPITIHVPFPKGEESTFTPVSSDTTEGTYVFPVTEHRKELQPINLVLNLKLILDKEETKPEQTEDITVMTEPSPAPPAKESSQEYFAHPLKIMTQNNNANARPTQTAPHVISQRAPDYATPGTAITEENEVQVSSPQHASPSKSYGVVPSFLLVPKRPVLHNVRSNMKADVPEVPLSQFRRKLLSEHNRKRLLHGAPPLTLDEKLNSEAQRFSAHLAQQKKAKHSSMSYRNGEGENIAVRCSLKGSPLSGTHAVDLWYDEGKRFNWTKPSFTPATERFTQMIWKNTTRVGFGRAKYTDKDGRTCFVIVARYEPLGNVEGKFADNVLKPKPSRILLRTLSRTRHYP